jgi:hypothetical protein
MLPQDGLQPDSTPNHHFAVNWHFAQATLQEFAMTSITIELPDELASQAAMSGLFDARHFERLVRASLRSKAKTDLQAIWQKLEHDPIAPLTDAELDAGAQSLVQ